MVLKFRGTFLKLSFFFQSREFLLYWGGDAFLNSRFFKFGGIIFFLKGGIFFD